MTMIEGRATGRYVRTSAQKAKLVMDLIRGQSVDRALATLRFSRKRIAGDVAKVLRSAVANAEQKEGAAGDIDRMFVSKCYADQGPSMKRIRPAPMGRAFRIVKRTAHLTVHVVEQPEIVARVVTPGESGSTEAEAGSSRPRRRSTKRSKRRPRKRSSD
jgi:large subunit ribosomal protein L22